jgi:hypothetical protein
MVLVATWGRYVDYPLAVPRRRIVARGCCARAVSLPALYAFAGAALS